MHHCSLSSPKVKKSLEEHDILLWKEKYEGKKQRKENGEKRDKNREIKELRAGKKCNKGMRSENKLQKRGKEGKQ